MIGRYYLPGWIRSVLILLLPVLLGLLVWANYQFSLESPGGNDFLARWTGAHFWLVEGINPYDERVSLEAQTMIYGRPANPARGEDVAHFVYPLPAMLFFAPFGLLPFTLARALWMTLLELSLPLLALIGLRLADWRPKPLTLALLLTFSVFWYHGLRSVIVGQFAVIEALLICGGLLAIQQRSDPLAGVLLALSLSKPQMAFLILPFVCWWALRSRRYGLLTWLLGSIAAITAASILILPDWPLLWLRQLVSYPSYTALGSPVSILVEGIGSGGRLLSWILSGALLAYLILEWLLAGEGGEARLRWTAALTLVVTNLVAFRTATTNYVVLMPVLLLIYHSWVDRWGAGGRVAVWIFSTVLLVGLWGLFLITLDGNVEAPIMYIPLPALTLVGLLWSRWWMLRSTQPVRRVR